MTDFLPVSPKPQTHSPPAGKVAQARQAAEKLEAAFLAEMLKAAGFGEQQNTFSGGTGEDQFASFHRHAIAERFAASGGIGLAEHFYRSMMEAQND